MEGAREREREREREADGGREGEREIGREGGRDRGSEGERERGRVAVTKGPALRLGTWGSLTLTFEMITSYLHASWWTVDSCMATIGEEGMLPGFSVQ